MRVCGEGELSNTVEIIKGPGDKQAQKVIIFTVKLQSTVPVINVNLDFRSAVLLR